VAPRRHVVAGTLADHSKGSGGSNEGAGAIGMQQEYKIGEAFTMSLNIILAASRGAVAG
jgi:uncharacterized protein affecting Mg2+/Co2+ transport